MKTAHAVKFQREQTEKGVIIGMSIFALWVVWLV